MEKISPRKIYGVLGFPAKHSLSPLMHNAAFKTLKINARYKIFEAEPKELKNFICSLSENHIFGLNVTVPYKEKVIPFLDKISDEARLIGAVNTIKLRGDKLEGFNTDGEGFIRHLRKDLRFNPNAKSIALIGAGGAARAISVYLAKAKAKAITIYDIDKSKAQGLVKHLKANFNKIRFEVAHSVAGLKAKEAALLINATPRGMKEKDPEIIDNKFLPKNLLVYDLIYNPAQTKLLKLAKAQGCRTSNGLGMLLYQGAASFELWTGKRAPIGVMRKALNKHLALI